MNNSFVLEGIGFNDLPNWEGSKGRQDSVRICDDRKVHWESKDFLYNLALRRVERLQNAMRHKEIPSLSDLCISCFFKNQKLFTSKEVLQLPYLIQDQLVELLCEFDKKEDCLDLFLSSATYHISLPVCTFVTDLVIRKVAQRCTGLKELILRGFIQLSDESLEQIGLYCPSLKSLDFSFCYNITDQGISKVAEGCSKLSKLSLHHCTKITHKGIVQIGKKCKSLRTLNITGTQWCEESLLLIITNCPKLTSLVVYNTPISPANIFKMLRGSRRDIFESVDIFESPRDVLVSAVEAQSTSPKIVEQRRWTLPRPQSF